jgi:hypothetical protein
MLHSLRGHRWVLTGAYQLSQASQLGWAAALPLPLAVQCALCALQGAALHVAVMTKLCSGMTACSSSSRWCACARIV